MNIFDRFTPQEQEYEIKALDGAKVVLRQLSLEESTAIGNKAVKSIDSKGKPIPDLEQAGKLKYYKISAALIRPKMTPKQLWELSQDATEAIDEIFAIVDPATSAAIEKARGNALSEK